MADFAARRVTMVDTQVRPNDVTLLPIIESMLSVPRERFVPEAIVEVAYSGENLPLSRDRVVLEARTFAKMIDALDIQPDELVLDLACGLGYSTAVMAHLAQAVVGVEDDAAMVAEAQARLAETEVPNAVVVQGDLAAGWPGQAPYDVIMVNGAIEAFPQALADQLKDGGRVAAIFKEGNLGVVRIGLRVDGRIEWRFGFNAHAPLLPGFSHRAGFSL
ncbi:MAG: protein-L-isoaspartate O-methyltransferase [Paracoccus sp. (in: a-proteobacteria)]|uniref:protein-L-isoaspartate O-methyltransferase family protein n=1 Tax=Paracoccus sp. TaxID=267 RepID=UPI0026E0E1BA|nr:protein-L-isoaspartate O-methyltransferase [Paracoccus sp. (in: a-proteobacteria)]MDO5620554.1 protein-L-isoaspartate O-methyltransferase [Paracoccus sp. (in: a-proteobacteria)]